MKAFSTLELRAALLASVEALGYTEMTPVQAQSLPPMLARRDVIAQAQTGSGKTAAFGLALLQTLDAEALGLQALVLCPTRELADQVGQAIRKLAVSIPNVKLLILCGGMPMRAQLASLAHDPHIVVGTPGRVLAHLRRGSVDARGIRTLVLDEADRMLDMGFEEDIDHIVSRVAQARQTLLFSATWPASIRAVSGRLQRDPQEVTIVEPAAAAPAITQHFYEIDAANKPAALAKLLAAHPEPSEQSTRALVFCNTRRAVDEVAGDLSRRGFSALPLHGDMPQRDRDEVLIRFAHRSCGVLVATDVAARGLDIAALPLVICYDIASDADTHTHRIGRTGRAGESGIALTLCAPGEWGRAEAIESALGARLRWSRIESGVAGIGGQRGAPMKTLVIDGGRRDKLRPGDILGALTGEAGLAGTAVGKIDIHTVRAYVAVRRDLADSALARLRAGRIKGRNFRVRALG